MYFTVLIVENDVLSPEKIGGLLRVVVERGMASKLSTLLSLFITSLSRWVSKTRIYNSAVIHI